MNHESFKDYVEVAQKAIKQFSCSPLLMKTYQYTEKKAVWFVKTIQQNYALKRYKVNKEQWEFMISAYDFLSKTNHWVSPLLPTNEGNLYFADHGYYYILTTWIKGTPPNLQIDDDIFSVTKGLASLHIDSAEFPISSTKLSSSHKKAEELRLTQGLLLEYKHQAEENRTNPFSQHFLKEFKPLFETYEDVCSSFEHPRYLKWCKELNDHPCLCIGSLSPQNFSLASNQKLHLLHIDHIGIDLPTHDLRKLISKVMFINKHWSERQVKEILSHYLSIHPLTEDQFHILLAELKTPYLISNTLSRYYLKLAPTWTEEKFLSTLNTACQLEKEKRLALKYFWSLI